jgi:hypothetical protein
MPHLPTKLFAATLVFGFALLAMGHAKAAPLPIPSSLTTHAGASQALPVVKVHRRYRYWGPRYNYWYGGPRYYYHPYYYGYGYRPYWYWNRPYYRRYWW